MKTLYAFGDELQAEKIVKTETSILGYIAGKEVFSFQGIRDFEKFSLANGEEWNITEEKEIEQLRVEVDELRKEVEELKGGGTIV